MNDAKTIKAAEVCAGLHGKSCAPCPYYVNADGVTVMVDVDGNPLIYEEDGG